MWLPPVRANQATFALLARDPKPDDAAIDAPMSSVRPLYIKA
ncbi:hypothetical protein QE432_005226 [Agrobacterium sp. SORGH_AS 745]|nr:hypothetical protein [Agrobacterium tumefaciens]MDQ1223598.1 hypothetical protein [Agrobacterium sp. SORGH_AS_0745]